MVCEEGGEGKDVKQQTKVIYTHTLERGFRVGLGFQGLVSRVWGPGSSGRFPAARAKDQGLVVLEPAQRPETIRRSSSCLNPKPQSLIPKP